MTRKSAQSKPTSKPTENRNVLRVPEQPGKTRAELEAEVSFSAVVLGATAARPWAEKAMGPLDFDKSCVVLARKAADASAGDLTAAKQMLMTQAVTLDAIFNDMARKAANLIKTNADGSWTFTAGTMEAVMRVAFKAQGQCRNTLQTLGELVNPRSVAFIKQANMAHGPQQVNNGGPGEQQPSRPQQTREQANELLEDNPSERLDTGAQTAAGGANSVLAAVGAVHRTKH